METKTSAKRERILELDSSGGLRDQIQMKDHVALSLLDTEEQKQQIRLYQKRSKKKKNILSSSGTRLWMKPG